MARSCLAVPLMTVAPSSCKRRKPIPLEEGSMQERTSGRLPVAVATVAAAGGPTKTAQAWSAAAAAAGGVGRAAAAAAVVAAGGVRRAVAGGEGGHAAAAPCEVAVAVVQRRLVRGDAGGTRGARGAAGRWEGMRPCESWRNWSWRSAGRTPSRWRGCSCRTPAVLLPQQRPFAAAHATAVRCAAGRVAVPFAAPATLTAGLSPRGTVVNPGGSRWQVDQRRPRFCTRRSGRSPTGRQREHRPLWREPGSQASLCAARRILERCRERRVDGALCRHQRRTALRPRMRCNPRTRDARIRRVA